MTKSLGPYYDLSHQHSIAYLLLFVSVVALMAYGIFKKEKGPLGLFSLLTAPLLLAMVFFTAGLVNRVDALGVESLKGSLFGVNTYLVLFFVAAALWLMNLGLEIRRGLLAKKGREKREVPVTDFHHS